MKKTIKMLSLCLLTLSLIMGCIGCNQSADTQPTDDNLNYVTLRINPEIELITDENDIVVSAGAINVDGEVVLSELDVEGKSIEDVGEEFTQKSVELGYLDVETEGADVFVEVDAQDQEVAKKIKKKLAEKINHYFENNGIYGKVSSETLEKYAENAQNWDVSLGEAKLIIRILDLCPELTEEEVLSMKHKERIAKIHEVCKQNKISKKVKHELKQKVDEIKAEFENIDILQAEIKELKKSLKDETLTEEQIAEINAQIDAKVEELKQVAKEYKEQVKVVKEEFAQKSEKIKEDTKTECEEKIKEHKEKIASHKQNFEKDKDKIKKNIKEWQDIID